ncbi:MAG: hypothetical protein WDM85_08965 [Caulobacteraceae bacterium]
MLLLHGFPGNEQNLDLARAMQREGWNVLTMHYRGAWGSRGDYSFTHCIEDAQAALAWLRAPDGEAASHIDPTGSPSPATALAASSPPTWPATIRN